jgi:hypothetical protein
VQPGAGDSDRRSKTRTRVKDSVGEVGGVNTEDLSDVRSPPLSTVQVFGLERGHMSPGFVRTRL